MTIVHSLSALYGARAVDSALKRSLCPLGADTLVAETEGKGIKNETMLDWAKACEGDKQERAWGKYIRSGLSEEVN